MEKLNPGFEQGNSLLEKLCWQRQAITTLNQRVRLHPGNKLITGPDTGPVFINGRFGMVLTLAEDPQIPVAQCGFDMEPEELVITNTPQGLTREKLSHYPDEAVKSVMRELREGKFRSELLEAVVRIGKSFMPVGIKQIRGTAAQHHDKVDVNGGPLNLTVAMKSMNHLYESYGFLKEETGDYYLPL